ncbi:hypothetical protein COT07_04020 [Candidatus Woesearchaeota archaeon CG07_land_8_20_14_0_80_44_23]|nr:MAG: hypothetical protein COT07_04020 [Candidatus Woesearchaeota archaeon CG07_land_8_20_14_0_80_44_23]
MLGKQRAKEEGAEPKKELDKMQDEEDNEGWEKSVLARAIIEILGAPKDYVETTLNVIADTIKKNEDLRVEKEEFFEPKKQEKLFSAFMELDIRFRSIEGLFGFCIDFMPSSVDILEPEKIDYDSAELTRNVNDLMAKLHKIDSALKQVNVENELLQHNAMLLLRNNVIITLGEKKMNLKELSSRTGVPEEQLKNFLELWIKEGMLKSQDELYFV